MASTLRDLRLLLRAGYGCLQHTQLGRSGALETLSSSTSWRSQHTSGETAARPSTKQDAKQAHSSRDAAGAGADDDDAPTPPPLRFVSSEQRISRDPPARRIPICFPNLTLQMQRLPDHQLVQLRETGWLREVVFKTTPDVTKLEIAAFLESVYGMSVERVNTINYLGRRRVTISRGGKKMVWREDDWKKAYVVFRPPPGMGHLLAQRAEEEAEEEDQRPVIERMREAARAPRPARRALPWEGRSRTSGSGSGSSSSGSGSGSGSSSSIQE